MERLARCAKQKHSSKHHAILRLQEARNGGVLRIRQSLLSPCNTQFHLCTASFDPPCDQVSLSIYPEHIRAFPIPIAPKPEMEELTALAKKQLELHAKLKRGVLETEKTSLLPLISSLDAKIEEKSLRNLWRG